MEKLQSSLQHEIPAPRNSRTRHGFSPLLTLVLHGVGETLHRGKADFNSSPNNPLPPLWDSGAQTEHRHIFISAFPPPLAEASKILRIWWYGFT